MDIKSFVVRDAFALKDPNLSMPGCHLLMVCFESTYFSPWSQYFVKSQHANVFGEYTYMKIRPCLESQCCEALPFVHTFTGCDIVSSMFGIGTKTAWNACVAYPEISETILIITEDPSKLIIASIHMKRLERWTVLIQSNL